MTIKANKESPCVLSSSWGCRQRKKYEGCLQSDCVSLKKITPGASGEGWNCMKSLDKTREAKSIIWLLQHENMMFCCYSVCKNCDGTNPEPNGCRWFNALLCFFLSPHSSITLRTEGSKSDLVTVTLPRRACLCLHIYSVRHISQWWSTLISLPFRATLTISLPFRATLII